MSAWWEEMELHLDECQTFAQVFVERVKVTERCFQFHFYSDSAGFADVITPLTFGMS